MSDNKDKHCRVCRGSGIGIYEYPDHPQPCLGCEGTGLNPVELEAQREDAEYQTRLVQEDR